MVEMMKRDALQYRFAVRNPMIIKELYQEWWFFEVSDTQHDLKFMINCSINNPANLAGALPKGCDIASAITIGTTTRSTPKEKSFMEHFEASQKILDVSIGDTVFFKAIDDDHIRLWGKDPGTEASFDLVYTRNLPAWKKRKTRTGSRFFDSMWYLPAMPSAWIDGTIDFDGKTFAINHGIGYHDHFWGSPTQFRWSPWVTVNDSEFEIIAVIVPTSSDFSGACVDRKAWINLGRPYFTPESWVKDFDTEFDYPSTFKINANTRNYNFEMTLTESGSHASLDGGLEGYKCPIIWSWNYLASGNISKRIKGNWRIIKKFESVPASIYYFSNFDFAKLATQLGIDISEYKRFLK